MPPRRSRCSRGLTRAVAGALAVTALAALAAIARPIDAGLRLDRQPAPGKPIGRRGIRPDRHPHGRRRL